MDRTENFLDGRSKATILLPLAIAGIMRKQKQPGNACDNSGEAEKALVVRSGKKGNTFWPEKS